MGKLINISEAASLAIHSLALIGGSREPLNANTMANKLGASRNHISKVLHQLVKHNYLSSTRGPAGGFNLKIAPENISLLEIYELIEGSLDVEYCSVHNSDCPFVECVYGNIREKLTGELRDFFHHRKISHIIITKPTVKQDDRL